MIMFIFIVIVIIIFIIITACQFWCCSEELEMLNNDFRYDTVKPVYSGYAI